jgi:PadR family transcriptional regulator, regulatory protein PadR
LRPKSLLSPGGQGMPNLSPTELVILRALITGPLYGQELVTQSNGELKRGTVYVTLNRMEEKGFVESFEEKRPHAEGGLPRRRYRVTGEGQRALHVVETIEAALAGAGLT